MLLVIAESASNVFADELDRTELSWKFMQPAEMMRQSAFGDEWEGVVIVTRDVEAAIATVHEVRLRGLEGPCFAVVPVEQVPLLATESTDTFDDFAVLPLIHCELSSRVHRHMRRIAPETFGKSNLVSYGGIELNISTYQATVAGRLLDMTYMEYELLKYFVTNSNRVLTREQLLKDVWRYEYYGGARTVDVHVRRLRAKLGDEYAQLIQTVRSVGYIFGSERWAD